MDLLAIQLQASSSGCIIQLLQRPSDQLQYAVARSDQRFDQSTLRQFSSKSQAGKIWVPRADCRFVLFVVEIVQVRHVKTNRSLPSVLLSFYLRSL